MAGWITLSPLGILENRHLFKTTEDLNCHYNATTTRISELGGESKKKGGKAPNERFAPCFALSIEPTYRPQVFWLRMYVALTAHDGRGTYPRLPCLLAGAFATLHRSRFTDGRQG